MNYSDKYVTSQQDSRNSCGRSFGERVSIVLWQWCWQLLCSWTPKPFNQWRLMWLRLFGAKLYGQPFVHGRSRIELPWNLVMRDGACIGDGAVVYSLGPVELGERCVIAQECYLCTGTHKFDDPALPLQVAPIVVKPEAFVGARAFVLPGTTIGEGALVGACAVVTKDVESWSIVAGNPAVEIGKRPRLRSNLPTD